MEEKRLRAQEEWRQEAQRNCELHSQLERMLLSPHQRNDLQSISLHFQMSIPTLAIPRHHSRCDVAVPAGCRIPSGGHGAVLSHIPLGGMVDCRREASGEIDNGRKWWRTGEQEESRSPTYNLVRPHEEAIVLPTPASTGLSPFAVCDAPRNCTRIPRNLTLRVEYLSLGPEQVLGIGRHVRRVPGPRALGDGAAQPANYRIPRTELAPIRATQRVELVTEPGRADLCKVEDKVTGLAPCV